MRNFIQRVIADLMNGNFSRSFNTSPVHEDAMLFSLKYNDLYFKQNEDTWHIRGSLDPFIGMFRRIELKRGDYYLELTKHEKKALFMAYDFAIKVEKLRYKDKLEKLYD
jgi:hypothetical protein